LDYLDDRPAAGLVYRRGKHVINVFTWPSPKAATSVATLEAEHGYNVQQLTVSGMNCWVVSDLNRQELDKFAALLRARG
jgi:anti-sigma factor RsiW